MKQVKKEKEEKYDFFATYPFIEVFDINQLRRDRTKAFQI